MAGLTLFVSYIVVGAFAIIIDLFVRNKQITTISAIYFGLLIGLLLGWLFSAALEPVVRGYLPQESNRRRLLRGKAPPGPREGRSSTQLRTGCSCRCGS